MDSWEENLMHFEEMNEKKSREQFYGLNSVLIYVRQAMKHLNYFIVLFDEAVIYPVQNKFHCEFKKRQQNGKIGIKLG